MKKILMLIPMIVIAGLLFNGCGETKKYNDIKSLQLYKDPAIGFSLLYPSNWNMQSYPGDRFLSLSDKNAQKRFHTYDTEGLPAAMVEVQVLKIAEGQTIDSVMQKKVFVNEVYSAPKTLNIDGCNVIMQSYTFPLNDGIFNGEIYYAQKDPNLVTVVKFEAFAGSFDRYKEKFAEIVKSLKFAQFGKSTADTVKKVVELPYPSEKFVNYNGDGFTIQVPDNFDAKGVKAGGTLKGYQFIGERRADCEIRIDIIDASKQNNVEKIANQNKAAHGNTNPSASTLAGMKSMVFNYSPVSGVMSRAYYVVKDNKCFRITMNWFKGEEQHYKPVFEKMVNSIKFK